MKKVYDREQFFFIKGQTSDFEPTSIWRHLRVMDEDAVMEYERRYSFQDFQALWELVESGAVLNAEVQKGLFGGRSIHFQSGIDGYTVREKNFKEVTIWWHCAECFNVTMSTLLESLPAEDLTDYLRERGIGLTVGTK